MDSEIRQLLLEIAGFYENPSEALEILESAFFKGNGNLDTLDKVKRFRNTERQMYGKRLVNGIKRSTTLLRIALDESPLHAVQGSSLGWPAYQAESYYQGKGSV